MEPQPTDSTAVPMPALNKTVRTILNKYVTKKKRSPGKAFRAFQNPADEDVHHMMQFAAAGYLLQFDHPEYTPQDFKKMFFTFCEADKLAAWPSMWSLLCQMQLSLTNRDLPFWVCDDISARVTTAFLRIAAKYCVDMDLMLAATRHAYDTVVHERGESLSKRFLVFPYIAFRDRFATEASWPAEKEFLAEFTVTPYICLNTFDLDCRGKDNLEPRPGLFGWRQLLLWHEAGRSLQRKPSASPDNTYTSDGSSPAAPWRDHSLIGCVVPSPTDMDVWTIYDSLWCDWGYTRNEELLDDGLDTFTFTQQEWERIFGEGAPTHVLVSQLQGLGFRDDEPTACMPIVEAFQRVMAMESFYATPELRSVQNAAASLKERGWDERLPFCLPYRQYSFFVLYPSDSRKRLRLGGDDFELKQESSDNHA